MTQTSQAPAATPASRNVQRESLDQIVRLSIECAAEEQRIEQQHTESLEQENSEFQKTTREQQQRYNQRRAELSTTTAKQQAFIQKRYDTRKETLESQHQETQYTTARQREESDAALKKKLEENTWLSEAALVSIEMQADVEEKKAKQEFDLRLADVKSLENSVRTTLARYKNAGLGSDASFDQAARDRIAANPRAAYDENRQQSVSLLQQLQSLAQVRIMASMVPVVLLLVAGLVCGGVGWMLLPHDAYMQLLYIAGGTIVVLIIGFLIYRQREQGRVRNAIKGVHGQLSQSIATMRLAAKSEYDALADVRDRHIAEARRKSSHDQGVSRERVKSIQRDAVEQYRSKVEEMAQGYKDQLAAIEQEKETAAAELRQNNDRVSTEVEAENFAARQQTESKHAQALGGIERTYETQSKALAERWEAGLQAVAQLIASGSGIDAALIDWNSPAWSHWQSPKEFSGQVRFGEMKVDLAQIAEQVPAKLKLPDTFTVPAMLELPDRASLLVEADHAGRAASINLAQMVMARLLTQMPAGRVKFTLFDPVGLGQSFAGFMHLADHDESLVGSRIWTESEHMEQRLTDLTEHMETVIQKYLRNEYKTIDEYNAQAGELAEPVRFLVVADFPTGFEQESLRRLASIATTGPRCGVYTIILRDTRTPLPPGSRMEEVIARSVHLQHKNGNFTWDDAVLKRFPLRIDPPAGEKVLTALMDKVGKAAKEAKRVEVPFQSIAPTNGNFWSLSSKSDIRVPVGKCGATRLQSLRLGVGVAQHALVAGKTGSGKSNFMHTIVTNMAMWYGPDEVEFYLVDFKKGVEFKAYASSQLPHARAIAVESDREFGLSVLQRVDAELTRRGAMFRDAGAQEIGAFRDRTGQKLPRTILLIDEFQEFFSEDDKLAQEASSLLDRLVRQGRAFGVHVLLGSQTIGGSSGLARSTLGQIAVRVALQCTEADSQMILGDNNSAARLLTRPGEAVYNDAGGLVEANSPFQIAFLPDGQREGYLETVRELSQTKGISPPTPIVFEGNSAAIIRKNDRLMGMLQRPTWPAASSSVLAYVGEPVAIKEPTAVPFRRQLGANVLMVGQQEESAVAIFASMLSSLAAQHKPGEAVFYLMDGSPADSRYAGLLEKVIGTLPHETKVVNWRDTADAINDLSAKLKERQANEDHAGPAIYLLIFGLQRYRLLRHQEDDFSFGSKSDAEEKPKPDKQFAELLSEGPGLGIHNIIWADTPITLERTFDRGAMRQFDHRILFQMSASDSSNLIDSPLANRLGAHRALLYSEEQGTFEKCRPYEVPSEQWLQFLAERLKRS